MHPLTVTAIIIVALMFLVMGTVWVIGSRVGRRHK